MRVTRITLDHELGLIELKTGPGGDGDYVLLPLEVKEAFLRYVKLAEEEDAVPEPPYSGMRESADEAREGVKVQLYDDDGTPNGVIVMPGGWTVPKDQAYDFNTTDGIGAYQAATDNPPQVERGGYKYGEIKFTRSPELQKMHDGAMVNDFEEPVVSYSNTPYGPDERDGVIPGITPEEKPYSGEEFAIRDRNGFVVTSIFSDRENYTYHPGEGRWLPNPLPVYADEHGRGYRLKSPHIPHWSYDIQKYELHRVPTLALAAAKRAGKDTTNTDVAVIIKEMS